MGAGNTWEEAVSKESDATVVGPTDAPAVQHHNSKGLEEVEPQVRRLPSEGDSGRQAYLVLWLGSVILKSGRPKKKG